MDRRDLEQIDRFLSIVGKASLFEYFGVDVESDPAAVEDIVKKKRAWAQGQQANPKFRSESLWIIKNLPLTKKALIDERQDYWNEVQSKDATRNLEVLTLYIKGALADGQLTPKKEDAIRHQAAELGLPPGVVAQRIDECLTELGAARGGDDEPTDNGALVDYYQILEVDRAADQDVLEKAYRAKYRWARNLRDVKKASEVYAQLDEAWRILKDADKRALYNSRLEAQSASVPSPSPDPPSQKPQKDEVRTAPSGGATPQGDATADDSDIAIIPGAPPARSQQRGQSLDAHQAPLGTTSGRPIGFQSAPVQANDSIPPIRTQAPRPPDRIGGRSLGLGAQTNRASQRSPKLQLDGPEVHRISAWRSPVTVRFTVRNAGAGSMSGRVFSDRDWVHVSPARLDPEAERQTIEITVHPKSMPRSKAVSLVTVVADHGERKVVSIETQRQLLPSGVIKLLALGSIAFVVVMGLVASLLLGRGERADDVAAQDGTRLRVTVDPPIAGDIIVGGRPMRLTNGMLDMQQGLPAEPLVELKIDHWGFKPVAQTIEVRRGALTERTIELELDPGDTFSPPENAIPGSIPKEAVAKGFAVILPNMNYCLAKANIPPTRVYKVRVEGKVRGLDGIGRQEGHVYDVSFTRIDPALPAGSDPRPCWERQVRALSLVKAESDSFATFGHEVTLKAPDHAP